jgi:anti-sigma regulatory factor (Ser/Thr protein kinase)
MELDRARDALSTGQTILLDRNELALAAPRIALGRGIAGLQAVQDHLTQFLRNAGCHKRTLFRAETVVKETLSNIRRHAELPDRPARAWIEAWITERHAVIAVEDDGPPFDPLAVLAVPRDCAAHATPRGGLRQIRRNADTVCYARTLTGHNRLELHIGLAG